MRSKISSIAIVALLGSFLLHAQDAWGQKKPGQRGVKVRTEEKPKTFNDVVYENLWAVVIGINDYKHWDNLGYAVNDARAVKELLIRKFGFRQDRIIELLDKEATRAAIEYTLGGMLPKHIKNSDGVIIFFAGHGETVTLPGTGGSKGYLVPHDGATNQDEYYSTLLPMTAVRDLCSMIPAKHIFFVVDACYSGLAAVSERGMTAETRQFVGKLAAQKCRVILTAGGAGEPVIEMDEWGHSAFTYVFLDGLKSGAADFNDDGVITSSEIANYVKARVPKLTGSRQAPQFKNLTNDEGEFIFFLSETSPQVVAATRAANADEPQDPDALKKELEKELERLRLENERLKREKELERTQPQESKRDNRRRDALPPPP